MTAAVMRRRVTPTAAQILPAKVDDQVRTLAAAIEHATTEVYP